MASPAYSDISLPYIVRFKVILGAELYFIIRRVAPPSESGPAQGLFLLQGGFPATVAHSGVRPWVSLNSA